MTSNEAFDLIMEADKTITKAKEREAEIEAQTTRMREASGAVTSANPLVCLLYVLLRDELSSSQLEEAMLKVGSEATVYKFTNGWLANYAKDIAERLGTNPESGEKVLGPWEEWDVLAEADWVRRNYAGDIIGRTRVGGSQTREEVDEVLRKCGYRLLKGKV